MGGICFFHILEAQMDSRLQRLDPPKRPMHYYGSTSNLVILLQFFYFSDEKTNLIYITTPGVPASLLNMGSGSSTRERRGFIPNVKPHLLPVDDFVAQIIRDVLRLNPLTKLQTRTSDYIYLGVTRLGFQMKEILE